MPERAPLRSGAQRRWAWRKYRCNMDAAVRILGRTMPCPAPAQEAWTVFADALDLFSITGSAWTYVCRRINHSKTGPYSDHAYGTAVDINPSRNPYTSAPFSWDDTEFSPTTVARLLAIRTNSGGFVFAWGGHWGSVRDYMHWYLIAHPLDLATGIDYDTVYTGETTGKLMFCEYGDESPAVMFWQRVLNYLGYGPNNGKGVYDAALKNNVSRFMEDHYGTNSGYDIMAIEAQILWAAYIRKLASESAEVPGAHTHTGTVTATIEVA